VYHALSVLYNDLHVFSSKTACAKKQARAIFLRMPLFMKTYVFYCTGSKAQGVLTIQCIMEAGAAGGRVFGDRRPTRNGWVWRGVAPQVKKRLFLSFETKSDRLIHSATLETALAAKPAWLKFQDAWPRIATSSSRPILIMTPGIPSILSNTELSAIARAGSDGISGVRLDYQHLKLFHLMLPLRNVMSYMRVRGIDKFPACFLDVPVPGREPCKCSRHGPVELEKAVAHHLAEERDKHVWIDFPKLEAMFGVCKLCDEMNGEKKHDLSTQKFNNAHSILDSTSATKLKLAETAAPTDAAHFAHLCCDFVNEGCYLFTLLMLLDYLPRSQVTLSKVQEDKDVRKKLEQDLLRKMNRFAESGGGPNVPKVSKFDDSYQQLLLQAMLICVELFGKQPFSGYASCAWLFVAIVILAMAKAMVFSQSQCSICGHMFAYGSICQHVLAYGNIC
jgi:hypothetical protein